LDGHKADRELVMEAVKSGGTALQFASVYLKADRELVLAAVRRDGSALQFASVDHKADRVIVLAAVKSVGTALQFASVYLKADRVIVLAAVKSDGTALQFVSEALKADREIVAAAVKQTGVALQYASVTLKDDTEVVLVAMSSDMHRWAGFSYASYCLKAGGLKAYLQKALPLYDTPYAVFVRIFLCSVLVNTTKGFPKLNSDVLRHIAAFAGVQMQGRFAALKVAGCRLQILGPHSIKAWSPPLPPCGSYD
jgi:hypothetical protein